MELSNKLFMILLGCRPQGRFTEQHDIFFGIAPDLKDLVPEIKNYWPEAKGKIHIDAWREVSQMDGYKIIIEKNKDEKLRLDEINPEKLFFVNLGGYKEDEFDEFHYKIVVVAADMKMAQRAAMKSAFFKHFSIPKTGNHKRAAAHIDDKYGIDVDDIYPVTDILSAAQKSKYTIRIVKAEGMKDNPMHLGYLKLTDLIENVIVS